MKLWDKAKLVLKAQVPEDDWKKKFLGKTLIIDGKPVYVESICGNKFKPAFYEVNGTHLIGILRAYCQIHKVRDFSEEDFKAFEDMNYEVQSPQEQKTLAMELDYAKEKEH